MDYRVEFSKWWTNEFKNIKFPSQGTVFDYYLESGAKKWIPWSEMIPKFEFDADLPLQVCCRKCIIAHYTVCGANIDIGSETSVL